MRVEVLIALLCSVVTAVGIVYLGAQFFAASSPPSQPQAKGIVWGGRTFVDLAQFGRWLRSQGFSYEVWALRHPTRAGIAPLRPPAVRQAQPAPQPSGARHRSNWTTLAGIAVVLAALSLVFGIRRRSWLPRMRRELTREQLAVAARDLAAAATAGARLMRRLAIVAARASSSLARSAALVLAVAAQGVAGAATAGARLTLRFAIVAARGSSSRARAGARVAWRRRGTLTWYLAAAVFATVSALALTIWA